MPAFRDILTALRTRYAQAKKLRRDRAALLRFDDHQLDDLGITRGEIEDYLAGRLPRRSASGPQTVIRPRRALRPRLRLVDKPAACCPTD